MTTEEDKPPFDPEFLPVHLPLGEPERLARPPSTPVLPSIAPTVGVGSRRLVPERDLWRFSPWTVLVVLLLLAIPAPYLYVYLTRGSFVFETAVLESQVLVEARVAFREGRISEVKKILDAASSSPEILAEQKLLAYWSASSQPPRAYLAANSPIAGALRARQQLDAGDLEAALEGQDLVFDCKANQWESVKCKSSLFQYLTGAGKVYSPRSCFVGLTLAREIKAGLLAVLPHLDSKTDAQARESWDKTAIGLESLETYCAGQLFALQNPETLKGNLTVSERKLEAKI